MSKLEDTLANQIHLAGLPPPVREFKAVPGRRFSFDFAWPSHRLLLEVQGGTWGAGRSGHSTGSGINRDCEKVSLAVLAGFQVMLADAKQVTSGMALRWLQQVLKEAA